MRPTLSVAIATFNEEKNIARCLAAVKDWVDEIIVADGTSVDKTVDIAKQYTSHVVIVPNNPLFHINKNIAIDAASKDWILQLDADEVVSPELKAEIVQILETNPEENGFWLPRANYFLGRFLKKGGQYPDYTLRLYRRGKGRLPAKDVHEQAVVEGKTGYLHHNLLHYADPSFARYLLRWNRYTTLAAQELVQGHAHPTFIVYFVFKPMAEFIKIYVRHRGYVDGFPGFVFAFFSGLRFSAVYIKYWERMHANRGDQNILDWQ